MSAGSRRPPAQHRQTPAAGGAPTDPASPARRPPRACVSPREGSESPRAGLAGRPSPLASGRPCPAVPGGVPLCPAPLRGVPLSPRSSAQDNTKPERAEPPAVPAVPPHVPRPAEGPSAPGSAAARVPHPTRSFPDHRRRDGSLFAGGVPPRCLTRPPVSCPRAVCAGAPQPAPRQVGFPDPGAAGRDPVRPAAAVERSDLRLALPALESDQLLQQVRPAGSASEAIVCV